MGRGFKMAVYFQRHIYYNGHLILGRSYQPVSHGIYGYFNHMLLGYKPKKSASSYASGIAAVDGV